MYKLKILILFFLLFYTNLIVAQQVFTLRIKREDNVYTYFLSLYISGEYNIIIPQLPYESEFVGDMVKDFILSEGKYNKQNNLYFLNEKILGYNFVLEQKNNKLKVIKGFSCLKNKNFIYCFDDDQEFISYYKNSKISIQELSYKKSYFEKTFVKNFPLIIGTYYDYINDCFLVIRKNRTFRFGYGKLPISEGTWRRENNVLILNDNGLKFDFILFIYDSYLLTFKFPCYDEDTEFYLKADQSGLDLKTKKNKNKAK